MLNIIICGINGSMGTNIYKTALSAKHEVTCGIDNVRVGNLDCPVYTDFDQIRHLANVIIDFSSPSITDKLLDYAKRNQIPLVIGTTGHSKKQEEDIEKASKQIAIFKSANTSLGVLYFAKLCKIASQYLKGFDVQIIEKHHKNKKDSPSGTANLLKTHLINDNVEQIQIHSIRGGSVVGEHSVLFLGDGESFTLTHTAESKELFAKGAIKASEFIINKTKGLYSTKDLI
ncbi:MAG: 4-hydroxy-tetrahydrodipicolinate reductase [Clostridia bacterium]|nr:4-hydroxy-tetrahydrodipicolinate reductase [Clostridia bacterium]